MSKHNTTITTHLKSSANRAHKEIPEAEIREQMLDFAHDNDVPLPPNFTADGKLHRYDDPAKPKGNQGLYVKAHLTFPANIYCGNFRVHGDEGVRMTAEEHKSRTSTKPLTEGEQAKRAERQADAEKKAKDATEKKATEQAEAAVKAKEL